ncbi:protein eiger [Musca vetustissima]|uniref:protein eiger n=1 Tax=Musca vetustissima TaxID=27455 RepID=UPI002AB7DEC1|nr:protein eiger [Musca vetustissima]
MTAETLKPFITPGSVDYVTASHSSTSSVHNRNRRCFLAIAASALVVVLISTLLGITIWHTVRISNLQTEVENLNKVIESMQKRLGLTYLDDLSDLEKEDENNNALIDDMLPDDDDDDDGGDDNDSESNSGEEDDEDEDADYTYDELIKKYSDYEEDDDDDHNNSRTNEDDDDLFDDDDDDDDNLYGDYGKFVESTKEKRQRRRKIRSLSELKEEADEITLETSRPSIQRSYKPLVAAENAERRRSPMRLYSSRRRKFPMIKSDKHLISAKTVISPNNALNEIETTKPAVHFHLTHKLPNHHSSVRVHSYNGDLYIGKPTWTNERESLDTYFHVENGVLTVHEPGLYYVYAQICYHNHHNQNGFIIFHGHKPFLQCLSHIFTNNNSVINTCHTSGLIYLKRDEQIHIQDFHTDRRTHLQEENNRSYFGLIKI